MFSSLVSDKEYFDDIRDISKGDKRIVRAGIMTYEKKGTYLTLKLYKKRKKHLSGFVKQFH